MVGKALGWGDKTRNGFEKYNVDLKTWVEGAK